MAMANITEAEVTHFMRGVVRLPPTSTRVIDADEEVFLLYTQLAAHKAEDGTTAFRGLGHINSHQDTLTISLRTGNVSTSSSSKEATGSGQSLGTSAKTKRRTRQRKNRNEDEEETLEVEIFQDKTALRSRKGDTGSVLWHASVDFAQYLLQQLHYHNPQSNSFLDAESIRHAHALELGAGTGLLGIVLSPFVRHYTITDIQDLVPLIHKNIGHNLSTSSLSGRKSKGTRTPIGTLNVTAAALDWLELDGAPATLRHRLVPPEPTDLLLVVDCIYHPSLLPGLVETIDYLTVPGRTAVVIVVELRAEDVLREFLQIWLERSGGWEIWSVGGMLEGPYAVWVGWKEAPCGDKC